MEIRASVTESTQFVPLPQEGRESHVVFHASSQREGISSLQEREGRIEAGNLERELGNISELRTGFVATDKMINKPSSFVLETSEFNVGSGGIAGKIETFIFKVHAGLEEDIGKLQERIVKEEDPLAKFGLKVSLVGLKVDRFALNFLMRSLGLKTENKEKKKRRKLRKINFAEFFFPDRLSLNPPQLARD